MNFPTINYPNSIYIYLETPFIERTSTQPFAVKCQCLWDGGKLWNIWTLFQTQKNRGDKRARFDASRKMLWAKKVYQWNSGLRKTFLDWCQCTSLSYKHIGIRNSSTCMFAWRLKHVQFKAINFDVLWITRVWNTHANISKVNLHENSLTFMFFIG